MLAGGEGAVLAFRAGRVRDVLRSNAPLVILLLFCAASVAWSDFPLVAFKRWVKAAGNVTMVLVVLTEIDATAAVRRLFTRTAFLVIPASILLIYFYPALGRYQQHPVHKQFLQWVLDRDCTPLAFDYYLNEETVVLP